MPGYYKQNRGSPTGTLLPVISTQLDSVRTYQFEVKFTGITGGTIALPDTLTLAAKKVSPIGGSVNDIVVDRVNDKAYYPGKFTPEPVTITFDNQYEGGNTNALWNWFKDIYDPISGDMTQTAAPGAAGGGNDFSTLEVTFRYDFIDYNQPAI